MELKPCPFCGEIPAGDDGVVATRNTEGYKWGAVSCCCSGPEVRTGYGPPEEWRDSAVSEWNRRPIEDALSAEIAALRAEVERLRKADEGAVTVEGAAWNVSGRWILPERGTVIVVPGPGRYRIICQPIEGKEGKP